MDKEFAHKLDYLIIPIMYRGNVKFAGSQLYVELGINTNILLNSNNLVDNKYNFVTDVYYNKEVNYDYLIGVGFCTSYYQIGARLEAPFDKIGTNNFTFDVFKKLSINAGFYFINLFNPNEE